MKNHFILLLSVSMIMLFSCQSTENETGEFKLLPLPQFAEFTGSSHLSVDDILFFYSADGSELPVLREYLSEIHPAEKQSQAQIVFKIDDSMDMKAEGYTLDISGKQIAIAGKDKAMEWFREHGMQVMGATAGQTRWVLMPQNESNMENIRSFVVTSIEKGLDGLLLTLWDDDSPHFELYMRGILAFAEYCWSGDQRGVGRSKRPIVRESSPAH